MYIRHGKTKTRKKHRCHVCSESISVHTNCWYYVGADSGAIFTLYYHDECFEYSKDWSEEDWEVCPGRVSRKDVLGAINGRI